MCPNRARSCDRCPPIGLSDPALFRLVCGSIFPAATASAISAEATARRFRPSILPSNGSSGGSPPTAACAKNEPQASGLVQALARVKFCAGGIVPSSRIHSDHLETRSKKPGPRTCETEG